MNDNGQIVGKESRLAYDLVFTATNDLIKVLDSGIDKLREVKKYREIATGE